MRSFAEVAVALAALPLIGCFHLEPINQRPALDIRADSSLPVFRGDTVELEAVVDDPEGQFVQVTWRIYLCADATRADDCDQAAFFTSIDRRIQFVAQPTRGDGTPTRSLRVSLEGVDDLGATTKPAQQLVLPVLDRSPTVELRVDDRYGLVVDTPIDLFAKYADGDDALGGITVEWKAFSPSQTEISLTEITVPQDPLDPEHRQAGMRLLPSVTGDWDIQVKVIDPLGNSGTAQATIGVVVDGPPCLAQVSPIVPPGGALLPVTAPTLFQVPLVADDLDRYPIVSDPILGAPVFAWSVLPPAGPRTVIAGATGNALAFDPAGFAPGSAVELRVEIFDRKATAIPCSDGDPTCSVIASACIQRQTWRLEVR